MTIEIKAPDFTPGYPSRGKKLGPAWQDIYAQLAQNPERLHDGQQLTGSAAAEHDLSMQTLRVLMSRAARYGVLLREQRPVDSHVVRTTKSGKRTSFTATRMHTHYRINPEYVDNLARAAQPAPLDEA
jgi:hypothetical protein